MNYLNHKLRTDLQEWKNRLSRASDDQFGFKLKFLLNNLDTNLQIKSLIQETLHKHDYSNEYFDQQKSKIGWENRLLEVDFESEIHQTAYCYQYVKYLITDFKSYNLHECIDFPGVGTDRHKYIIVENYISPIINYLHDKLDESNSIIYLLEKYKKRTEWFLKKELHEKYKTADKNYEQILENNLRLFLFDQGIDYPFSTPTSASGRADIIGEIETDDPLVVEIKILDKDKKYGKKRIKEGFNQILKYSNDYNKNVGYLVIFNIDEAEINFDFRDNRNIFPPSILFNDKIFYFVVINLANDKTASKSGKIQEIKITQDELTELRPV